MRETLVAHWPGVGIACGCLRVISPHRLGGHWHFLARELAGLTRVVLVPSQLFRLEWGAMLISGNAAGAFVQLSCLVLIGRKN